VGRRDKVFAGKCKGIWDRACLPTKLGWYGILYLDKFVVALRIRWLWHEWIGDNKSSIGFWKSSNEAHPTLFVAATVVIGNGENAKFLNSVSLDGRFEI
jgi:hypothetical protein